MRRVWHGTGRDDEPADRRLHALRNSQGPGLIRRYVTQTKPGITGQIFKLVVIQQITRGLSKGFSGGRTARTASTARAAAKVGWPTKWELGFPCAT
jgi:hypothetical protein